MIFVILEAECIIPLHQSTLERNWKTWSICTQRHTTRPDRLL